MATGKTSTLRKDDLSCALGQEGKAVDTFVEEDTHCHVCGKPATRMVCISAKDRTSVFLFCDTCYRPGKR